MTVTEPRQAVSDSLIFGNILISQTESAISARLESNDATVVTIERIGPRTRKNVPIGTRESQFILARMNETEIRVSPGNGKLFKRSYRILVEIGDRVISFRPKSIDTCMFIDGRPHEIEKQFCELTAQSDGSIEVLWSLPETIKLVGKTVVPPEPTVEDTLIGYALASAFGTGALSLTSIVLGMVSAALPG